LLESSQVVGKSYLRDGDGDWNLLAIETTPGGVSVYPFLKPGNDWAYSQIAGRSLDHDLAGNRTRDAWFDYEYDAFDRLVRVSDRFTNITIGRYSYDALTRRIEKQTWLLDTVRFLYDHWQIAETRDQTSQVTAQFLHGTWIDELVQWVDGTGAERYYLTDDRGSVVAITDAAGQVVERVRYDAFGAPTFLDAAGNTWVDDEGVPLAASPAGNPFLFQGREYDAELVQWRRAQESARYFPEVPAAGQYNFRYRYVSPEEGRFTSRDPLALASNRAIDPALLVDRILNGESASPYEMAAGNPVDRLDPLGLSTMTVKPGKNSRGILPHDLIMTNEQAASFPVKGYLRAQVLIAGFGARVGDALMSHVACEIPDGWGPDGPGRGNGGGSGKGPSAPSTGGGSGPSAGGGSGAAGGGSGGSGGGSGGTGEPGGAGGGSGAGKGGGVPPRGGTGLPSKPVGPSEPLVPVQPPSGGGGGGSGGMWHKVKVVGKTTGKAAGPVASAATLYNSPAVERPLRYVLECANPLTWVAVAVLEDVEAKIEDPAGALPQPMPAAVAETSADVFRRYLEQMAKVEAEDKKDGKPNWPPIMVLNGLKYQGRDMSCTLFSKLTDKRGPYDYGQLDCREAHKNANTHATDAPGTGSEGQQNSGSNGDGHEVGSVHGSGPREARVAALARFERGNGQRSDEESPLELNLLVCLVLVLSSTGGLRFGLR
jgi:RHS repeat-associated protein